MDKETALHAIKWLSEKSMQLYETNNLREMQGRLQQLYSIFTRSGGSSLIIDYGNKEQLGEAFLLMLRYDWMQDSDIREVWAENAFYCFIEAIKDSKSKQDKMIGALNLFLLLNFGKDSLHTKINDILFIERMRSSSAFDSIDYAEGSEVLIEQFKFYSANVIKPLVESPLKVMIDKHKEEYNRVLAIEAFSKKSLDEIFRKAKVVSEEISVVMLNHK